MLDTRHQPVLESLVERLGSEINAKAVLLLHENGQVIQRYGWIGEHEYPAMAALVAAMIATGKSLGALGEAFAGSPNRFSCDSEAMGLYMSFVSEGIWLTALYDQPMNPGLFRMKVRRYAELIARIGAAKPGEAQVPSPTLKPVQHPTSAPTLRGTAPSAPSPSAPAGASAYSRPAAPAPALPSGHHPLPAGQPGVHPHGQPGLLAHGQPGLLVQNVTAQGVGRAASPPPSAPATGHPEKFTEQSGGLFNNITDEEIDRLFDDASS
jgi:predicted regulator of Ras-like GTPase activity (Roadblock/LC7/MglB family)